MLGGPKVILSNPRKLCAHFVHIARRICAFSRAVI